MLRRRQYKMYQLRKLHIWLHEQHENLNLTLKMQLDSRKIAKFVEIENAKITYLHDF